MAKEMPAAPCEDKMKKKKMKIVQIVGAGNALYGLSNLGVVYVFTIRGWCKLMNQEVVWVGNAKT